MKIFFIFPSSLELESSLSHSQGPGRYLYTGHCGSVLLHPARHLFAYVCPSSPQTGSKCLLKMTMNMDHIKYILMFIITLCIYICSSHMDTVPRIVLLFLHISASIHCRSLFHHNHKPETNALKIYKDTRTQTQKLVNNVNLGHIHDFFSHGQTPSHCFSTSSQSSAHRLL